MKQRTNGAGSRAHNDIASIRVVTGMGLRGLKSADASQYFAGGSGFSDYMIFSTVMLRSGAEGVKAAGFFDNNWNIKGDSNRSSGMDEQ